MEPARSKTRAPLSGSRFETRKLRCAKQHYAFGAAAIGFADNRARPRRARISLATDKELSDFLKSVEKRAFKRTAYTVRDDDAALDIVQDAMIRLAEKYADRPAAELPLVFQRILSNATMDWFRRQKVRNAVLQNLSDFEAADNDDFDLLELLEADGQLGSESAADTVSRSRYCCASTPKLHNCLRVNGKLSCCVTGKNSMSPRRPSSWAARKAVSRHTARAPSERWQRRCRAKGITL